MNRTLATLAAAFGFATLITISVRADELEALSGKWVAERTDSQGRAAKQVLEIKKDKFIFKVLQNGDQIALYAKGDVKAEPLGPFKTARFFNIQGGRSDFDLQPVRMIAR